MDNLTKIIEHQTIIEDIVEAKELKLPHNNTTRTKRRIDGFNGKFKKQFIR
jgi:hypothetical protein